MLFVLISHGRSRGLKRCNSRLPVLDDGVGRVNDSTVHVEQESVKGDRLWWRRVRRRRRLCATHLVLKFRAVMVCNYFVELRMRNLRRTLTGLGG